MTKRPLILISPAIEKRGVEFHDRSISLSEAYLQALMVAGAVPLVMPTAWSRELVAECVRRADGVLLTGGEDVNPMLYADKLPAGLRRTVTLTPDGGERDLRELRLIDEVFGQRKPLLAICRGHQVLNVALGGTLLTDIGRQRPRALNHRRHDRKSGVVHEVRLTGDSLLAKITGKRNLGVNSTHHQAVDRVAGALRVTAASADGIVEGLELKPERAGLLPFLLAVQFHPERLIERHAEHRAIFRGFVRACAHLKYKTMKAKILVVDDSADLRSQLVETFKSEKWQSNLYEVLEAADVGEAKDTMAGPQPDVILLDIRLPGGDGLDLLPQFKKHWPETEVVLMTGALDGDEKLNAAVEATKQGAFHFLSKPFNLANLTVTVERALEHKQANAERRQLREELISTGGIRPVFKSAAMQAVISTVSKVAASDVSILITGETGTGKEVISNAVHMLSPRAKGPLIKVNCAALPRELIESELFGSVKGAYTGAHQDREGLFRQAEGGTLLLDEISEMPIDTQSKLLRVLQDKEVRPVGGKTTYKIDCRVIAATNRETDEAIQAGKLREDLFHRISQIIVHLPPLRERPEDILPLASAFLKFFAAQANKDITGFTPGAIERLAGFDWPGNVRQLQNEVQRAVLLCEGKLVDAADMSVACVDVAEDRTGDTSFTRLEALERNAIIQALKETAGNKLETAKRLGIGRQTLYNKIKAYGIEV